MSNETRTPTQRIEWLDTAKGLGISLIFVGHIWSLSEPPLFYQWLFAFHVPLFFFISGLTLKPGQCRLSEFIQRKARILLIPYFFYALLGYAFFVTGYFIAQFLGLSLAEFDYGLWTPLFGIMHGTVGDGYLVNSPLWFLPALYFSLSAAYIINTYIGATWLRWSLVALIATLGMAVGEHWRVPWGIIPAAIALVFVQAGYEFRRCVRPSSFNQVLLWSALILFAAASFFAPSNGVVGLAGPTLNNPFWFLFFSFVGIGLSITLVFLQLPWNALLARIGRYSLIILVIHMLVIKSVKILLLLLFGVSLQAIEQSFMWGLFVLALSIIVTFPLVHLINRWLPLTLGRPTSVKGHQNV